MRPAVDALATRCRVLTNSLPGEPGVELSGETINFDGYVRYVDDLLDAANVRAAVICGVSFGGLIALRYAARRRDRVRALVLVSAPGPYWRPDPSLARYLRWPTLHSPLFAVRALGRFWPELRVTFPDLQNRLRFCSTTLSRVMKAPAV